MSILKWDTAGERQYETGVDHCVLYKKDSNGDYKLAYAWNGITSITESPSGAEANPFYADNVKYLNLISAEDFACTIEAYGCPDQFMSCDGWAQPVTGMLVGQQNREIFGLAYRTRVGDDIHGTNKYKLHLVYNCFAAPSEKTYETINDSPSPATFSWEITTTPVEVTDHKPTAHVEIDSDYEEIEAIEAALFGTATTAAYLPLPDDLLDLETDAEGGA